MIREELNRSKLLKENEMSELPLYDEADQIMRDAIRKPETWGKFEALATALTAAGQDPEVMLQYARDAALAWKRAGGIPRAYNQDDEDVAYLELTNMYRQLKKYPRLKITPWDKK